VSNEECGSLIQPFAITLHTSLRNPSIEALLFRILLRESFRPLSSKSRSCINQFKFDSVSISTEILNDLQSIRSDRKDVSFRSPERSLGKRNLRLPRSLLERGMFAVVATTTSRVNSHYYYLSRRVSQTAKDVTRRVGSTLRGKSQRKQNKIEIDKEWRARIS